MTSTKFPTEEEFLAMKEDIANGDQSWRETLGDRMSKQELARMERQEEMAQKMREAFPNSEAEYIAKMESIAELTKSRAEAYQRGDFQGASPQRLELMLRISDDFDGGC